MALEQSQPVAPLHRLLTPEEVGAILARHPKTILRLVKTGELRAVKLGGRTVRFDPADVDAYIDRHRTDGTAPP